MRFIGGPRQCGKTTKMIEWLRGGPARTLLVHHEMYAKDLRHQYPELETQIASFDSFRNNLKDKGTVLTAELAIDNVDIILQRYFSLPIKRVTFTGELDWLGRFDKKTEEVL